MFQNYGFRCLAAFGLVLLLAGVPVHAAGSARPVTGQAGFTAGVAALWAWVQTALSLGPVAQTACDKGSLIDPDGGCRTVTAASPASGPASTADSDKGSYIDPDGG